MLKVYLSKFFTKNTQKAISFCKIRFFAISQKLYFKIATTLFFLYFARRCACVANPFLKNCECLALSFLWVCLSQKIFSIFPESGKFSIWIRKTVFPDSGYYNYLNPPIHIFSLRVLSFKTCGKITHWSVWNMSHRIVVDICLDWFFSKMWYLFSYNRYQHRFLMILRQLGFQPG